MLTKVKEKFQVTIPVAVREALGIEVGDMLQAGVEKGGIMLKQKVVVDPDTLEGAIAEGLQALRDGKVHGPFKNAKEMRRYLQRL